MRRCPPSVPIPQGGARFERAVVVLPPAGCWRGLEWAAELGVASCLFPCRVLVVGPVAMPLSQGFLGGFEEICSPRLSSPRGGRGVNETWRNGGEGAADGFGLRRACHRQAPDRLPSSRFRAGVSAGMDGGCRWAARAILCPGHRPLPRLRTRRSGKPPAFPAGIPSGVAPPRRRSVYPGFRTMSSEK